MRKNFQHNWWRNDLCIIFWKIVVYIWNIQGTIRDNEHICPLTLYIFFSNLNRRLYKLVTDTWIPNHKLKYIYIQRNETQTNKYNTSEQSQSKNIILHTHIYTWQTLYLKKTSAEVDSCKLLVLNVVVCSKYVRKKK